MITTVPSKGFINIENFSKTYTSYCSSGITMPPFSAVFLFFGDVPDLVDILGFSF